MTQTSEAEIQAARFPDGFLPWHKGMIACKQINDDEWLSVIPLTFGRARLCVCDERSASIEHWCMDDPVTALLAWVAWPLPPTKWNRHQRRDRVHECPKVLDPALD